MLEISKHIISSEIKMPSNAIEKIDTWDATDLSYNSFFENYMLKNIPVIIRSCARNWECSKNWVLYGDSTLPSCDKINIIYLKSKLPNLIVPVTDCTNKSAANSHKCSEMKMYDFLDYWEKLMSDQISDKIQYLKDWHLRKQLPEYEFYQVPAYFMSDWLNEYSKQTNCDDYMFVYMGPKGSWTSFHADVFRSYSWSTNIVGYKQWLLLSPGEEQKLVDRLGNTPFCISEEQLVAKCCKYFKIVQNPGETLFVPSGWYHQVVNLEDTISINHNWFNGCNIATIWLVLYEHYQQVCKEIEDCRDMDNFDDHCQIMLKASHGMDFDGFLQILQVIAENRIKSIQLINHDEVKSRCFGPIHCQFDLKSILNVICIIRESCSGESSHIMLVDKCNELFKKIVEFIEN